ncbi:hypothetical protein [Pseudomonas sp. dw_358]|uniref:hypothetical protein n=1 Tax=Pseudomonas sp. dw_358 TaxID=2720083 RepID=UPI001BD418C1|nr:hypothetical protein [Pseudomonas sp. dw_358]
MAFDAYSVAVRITLANQVSGGLKIVRDELQSTGFEVGRLNTKLEFLAKNARNAWSALRSGRDIASVFRGPANDAAKYQRELDKLHQTLAKPFAPVMMPAFHLGAMPRAAGGGMPPALPPTIPTPAPAHGNAGGGFGAGYHIAAAGFMSGGMMAMGGLAIAGAMKAPVENAMEYQRELAKLQQYGLGTAQIADAQKFVQANAIIGTSIQDRMRLFADAQGSFRESGLGGQQALEAARMMSPVLANYQVANSLLSGGHQEMAHAQFMNLNKTVELMGGLTDPAKAAAIADGVFKASQSSGKMVSERDLKQFMAYGGVAVSSLTPKTVFAGLEPIIGALGGSAVATGLMTAYSRTHGMMAMTPSLMTNEALRLGIWEADKVTRTKGGGARFEHGSPMNLELANLMNTNTNAFSMKLMDIYRSKGITSVDDIGRENAILFGRTGGKIYSQIMSQMPVLLNSELAYDKALGISQTIEATKGSPMMKMLEYHKALEDLGLAVGNAVMPVLMPMIAGLTHLAQAMSKHPTLVAGLTYAFMGLGAYLVTGGLITAIVAAGRGFMILGPALKGAFSIALPALRLLGTGIMVVGRALLMNPIGLAITAIAGAAYLLWNNWAEIKTNLFEVWGGIKTGIVQLFHGDIGGAFLTFKHVFLLGWQTLFNTLIAGVNKVLPASMAISKMTFADTPVRQAMAAPVPGKSSMLVQLTSITHLDGRKLSETVSYHQARELARPQTTPQGFDLLRSPVMPGTSSTAYPRG